MIGKLSQDAMDDIKIVYIYIYILVGGFEHVFSTIYDIYIYGMSSFPFDELHHFSEG